MNAPSPIVCVGFPRWEGGDYLKSTVQLMQVLARSQRVLYVDYPYTYLDWWRAARGRADDVPLAALSQAELRLQSLNATGLGELQLLRLPLFLPANFLRSNWAYDRLLAYNADRALATIHRALQQLGWSAPIVVNAFNPALGNALAGQLGEQQLVYYCYDEISAAPWISRHGSRHEREFLGRVDLTIVSSTGLRTAKAPYTKRCAVVKNGVDLKLFQASGSVPTELPAGPIIGYLGSVDDRLDYELLEQVARRFTEAQLVFVGRIMNTKGAERLTRYPNVHLLGPRPPAELGAYLSQFELGVIPFVQNKLTAGIYPLKINEYLALGKPVVSTDFADLSDFRGYCQVGKDTTAFLNGIAAALRGEAPACPTTRRAFAQRNSWESRAAEFAQLLGLSLPISSSPKALS